MNPIETLRGRGYRLNKPSLRLINDELQTVKVSTTANQQKPFSLRFRLVVLAVLLLTISLGLVGIALDAAFHRSSEAGLQARMESLVYLVLAATEVAMTVPGI